jgi:hypothetical protein
MFQVDRENLQFILNDVLQERRSRREPEHALTAAMVAYTSAVIWGVATLATSSNSSPITMCIAASITAVGSFAICAVICAKIRHSHDNYRKNQIALYGLIKKLHARRDAAGNLVLDGAGNPVLEDFLPDYMKTSQAGHGVERSIWIVQIAAGVAVVFSGFIAIVAFFGNCGPDCRLSIFCWAVGIVFGFIIGGLNKCREFARHNLYPPPGLAADNLRYFRRLFRAIRVIARIMRG